MPVQQRQHRTIDSAEPMLEDEIQELSGSGWILDHVRYLTSKRGNAFLQYQFKRATGAERRTA